MNRSRAALGAVSEHLANRAAGRSCRIGAALLYYLLAPFNSNPERVPGTARNAL